MLKVFTDNGVNQKKLKEVKSKFTKFNLVFLHADIDIEPQRKFESDLKGKAFRIGKSSIGSADYIAGDLYSELIKILSDPDADQLHSALIAGADIFLTNNPKDYVNADKREELLAIISRYDYSISILVFTQHQDELTQYLNNLIQAE